MDFQQWLKLKQVKQPNPDYQKYWVSHPNNQEEIDSWKKQNTVKVFNFPLNKESFIHFTPNDSVESILQDQQLGREDHVVFAVSTSYGIWFPVVQFNHILNKSDKFPISRDDLKNAPKNKIQYIQRLVYSPKNHISAIHFQTNDKPDRGSVEEVYWSRPIQIKNAKVIDIRMAINRLKNTPYQIGENDTVEYV